MKELIPESGTNKLLWIVSIAATGYVIWEIYKSIQNNKKAKKEADENPYEDLN